MAGRVTSKNQTVLDGVVIIQEELHELKRNKQEGVILKLDFEEAYESELEVLGRGAEQERLLTIVV